MTEQDKHIHYFHQVEMKGPVQLQGSMNAMFN